MKRRSKDEFAELFHQTNPTLELLESYVNSKTPLEWRCKKCGYKDHSYPHNLLNGIQCRQCRLQKLSESMQITEAEFQRRLHVLRPDLEALGEYKGYQEDMLFRCTICGYEWSKSPDVVLRSKQCPDCSGKRPLTHEDFCNRLKEISPTILLIGKFTTTKDSIKCRCLVCDAVWEPIASNLLGGSGCQECGKRDSAIGRHRTAVKQNNFAYNHPDIALEWDYERNGSKKPEDFSSGCDTEVWWICPVGHHYPATINSRTARRGGTGCSVCSFRGHTSFPEQAVFYYIKHCFPDAINNQMKIKRFSIDIFIPALRTAIEYDGRAWHGKDTESTRRDIRKYEACKEKGISLIRLQEASDIATIGISCDVMFESKFADKQFMGLDECISILLEYLGKRCDVHTRRDMLKIKAQYFTVLRENSISDIYPEIAKEWDYEGNGDLLPQMFTAGSQERVWWICPKGHGYPARIVDRVRGSSCSTCLGRKKTTEGFIEEMKLIDPNIEVLGKYTNNKTGILCRCRICGKAWSPTPNSLLDKHGCPDCADKKRAAYKANYHRKKKDTKIDH